MFVEIHAIQNFSPANLNRDDTNNPKDAEFGGVRRARISSQCLKRAIRTAPVFEETTEVPAGIRTKWLVDQLRERLVAAGKPAEQATEVLTGFVPKLLSKLEKGSEKTAVLLYVSGAEMESIVQAVLAAWDRLPAEATQVAKTLAKEHKGETSAPDIALFGRMLAEYPELGLDAATQVAHAISTHPVTMEMDFYTAVDDLNPDDTAGAGMMGFTGFDSACFYRYARIDWNQLVKNLGGNIDLARKTVEGFLRASVAAVPSGKQNSFAAYNPPSLLLAVVRRDGMGWSLANAFERPVYGGRNLGLVSPSVKALDGYWGRLCTVYGTGTLERVAALPLDDGLPLEHLGADRVDNLDEWIGAVVSALPLSEEASA